MMHWALMRQYYHVLTFENPFHKTSLNQVIFISGDIFIEEHVPDNKTLNWTKCLVEYAVDH